jgi:hypothetical protein
MVLHATDMVLQGTVKVLYRVEECAVARAAGDRQYNNSVTTV